MNPTSYCLGGILFVALSTLARADDSALKASGASAPPPSAGLANDWLRSESEAFKAWDVGGQVRLRYENKENSAIAGRVGAVDFRREGPDNDNDFYLTRAKLHIGYSPVDALSAFVEARDSRAFGDERNPSPDRDAIDLHQAYLNLGSPEKFPLSLKIGRQELSFGDERLVGPSDWSNVGRVFDTVKLRFENSNLWVDAFSGRVVMVDEHSFNNANEDDFLSGVYASTRWLPWQETQAYFLARNVGEDSPTTIGASLPALLTGASPRDIYTLGLRVKSLAGQLKGWDYEAEMAGQFGRFKSSASGPSLEHEAFAAHIAGGYTFDRAWGTPRVGLEYNFASGDKNPTDGRHGTFDNLFPTNHKFYGFMDFVSWQNIHNARFAAAIKPATKLTLTLDFHAFWLASTEDSFYQVNGAPRTTGGYGINPNAGSFVGTELDLTITYKIKPYAAAQAGFGHFFVGDYVRNSLKPVGGATDANWVYGQLTFNF